MKFYFSYLLTVILIALFAGVLIWFFTPFTGSSEKKMISPLPEFLMVSKNKEVSSMDLFLPVLNFFTESTNQPPLVTAKAAIVYDTTTGKTLFSKQPRQRVPMASLTKVMTAVIGIDNKLLSNEYVVNQKHLVGENSMGLLPGEVHTLENLLYGLTLLSGNGNHTP